jgi:hypothetical protein
MKPDPSKVLVGMANAVMVGLAAEARTPFGQTVAGMAGMLALALAQEVDRLPDRLNNENLGLAALLTDARALVDPALAAGIDEVANAAPANIRVSTLQALNDRLRGVLVDVHVAVEARNSPEARAMNDRVWAELIESVQRRHIEMPR